MTRFANPKPGARFIFLQIRASGALPRNQKQQGAPQGPLPFNRMRDGYSITGIVNSPPSLMPEGQRAVTVLVLV